MAVRGQRSRTRATTAKKPKKTAGKGRARPPARKASPRAESAVREAVGTATQTARRGAAIGQESVERGAETARRHAEAGGRSAQQAAETLRRGAESATRSSWQVAEGVSRNAADLGRSAVDAAGTYQQAMESVTPDLRALSDISRVTLDGVQELRQVWSEWAAHAAQSTAQATQELMRCRTFQDFAQVQSAFLKDYVQQMMEGSAEMLRVGTRLSQSALRPIAKRRQAA